MKSQRNSKKGTRKTHLLEADSGSSTLSSEEDEFKRVHKLGRVENRYYSDPGEGGKMGSLKWTQEQSCQSSQHESTDQS